MTLRQKVIEAGARAIDESGVQYYDEYASTNEAEAVLDAMLDCLTENADEWKTQAWEMVADTDRDVFGSAALAVLREDR